MKKVGHCGDGQGTPLWNITFPEPFLFLSASWLSGGDEFGHIIPSADQSQSKKSGS